MTRFWSWLTTSRLERDQAATIDRMTLELMEARAEIKRLTLIIAPQLAERPIPTAQTPCQADIQPIKAKRNGWSAIRPQLERDLKAEKSAESVNKNLEVLQ